MHPGCFLPQKRPICHFEQVGKSVLFFPLVLSRKHSLFSIRGSAGALASRMLEGLSYRNQYRYGRKWGNPRGSAPLCRRSRNQEVPGVSLPTFSTRESRPGRGAERPLSGAVGAGGPHFGECRGGTPRIGRCWGPRPRKTPPGRQREKRGAQGPPPPHQKNLLPFAAKYSIINGHDNKNAREGGRAVPQGRTCF